MDSSVKRLGKVPWPLAGGPTPGFGTGHEINALYAAGDALHVNLAVAGQATYGGNDNKIVVFIDSKSGGYNNTNFGRDNAPISIGGTQFRNHF